MIKCPNCLNKTKVLDTRGNTRRRTCSACYTTFSTQESIIDTKSSNGRKTTREALRQENTRLRNAIIDMQLRGEK